MTKEIPLTQGKVALVDDDVYEWAGKVKWQASRDVDTWYVRRSIWRNGSSRTIRLHREILQAPLDMQVDHINGNGLDCRRENLRLATPAENQQNKRVPRNSTTGFKGVAYHKINKKWTAQIRIETKRLFLGCYETPEDAARAYDEAARKYFGEFARTNKQELSP